MGLDSKSSCYSNWGGRRGIEYNKVREVSFDEDTGNIRVDSAGNLFPPDFIYSPYTGEKLKLGQPE